MPGKRELEADLRASAAAAGAPSVPLRRYHGPDIGVLDAYLHVGREHVGVAAHLHAGCPEAQGLLPQLSRNVTKHIPIS